MYRLVYDGGRYILRANNKLITENKCIVTIREETFIEIYDRAKGTISCGTVNVKKRSLDGEIVLIDNGSWGNIMPCFGCYSPKIKERLYYEETSGQIILIEYDGNSHIRIEDAECVYDKYIEGKMVNIKVINDKDSNISVITSDTGARKKLIIVRRTDDYEETLDAEGDNIIVHDNGIEVNERLNDMLGRIRHKHYTFDNGGYELNNIEFEYTYNIHYDKSMIYELIYDAIMCEDYGYIAGCMAEEMSKDDIKGYCEENIKGKIIDLKFRAICNDGIKIVTCDNNTLRQYHIRIEADNSGSVMNFEIAGG